MSSKNPRAGTGTLVTTPATVLPLTPDHHKVWRSYAHATVYMAVITIIAIAGAIYSFVMWRGKGSTDYELIFEGIPNAPSEVLSCDGDPQTHWAQTGGGTTNQCIFTGDMSLPGNVGVTEQEVMQKCTGRHDCGGYTVRVTSTYEPCSQSSSSACLAKPYNNGQPEFTLYTKRGMRDIRQTSTIVQGANHEVRTHTVRRIIV